jgi:hypothetical protein
MNTMIIQSLSEKTMALILLLWLAWLAARTVRQRSAQRHELRLKLLERLQAAELLELSRSAVARKWLERLLSGGLERKELRHTVLRHAAVLICVGSVGVGAGALWRFPGATAVALGGAIAAAWGIALVIAAALVDRRDEGSGEGR